MFDTFFLAVSNHQEIFSPHDTNSIRIRVLFVDSWDPMESILSKTPARDLGIQIQSTAKPAPGARYWYPYLGEHCLSHDICPECTNHNVNHNRKCLPIPAENNFMTRDPLEIVRQPHHCGKQSCEGSCCVPRETVHNRLPDGDKVPLLRTLLLVPSGFWQKSHKRSESMGTRG